MENLALLGFGEILCVFGRIQKIMRKFDVLAKIDPGFKIRIPNIGRRLQTTCPGSIEVWYESLRQLRENENPRKLCS